MLFFSVPWPIHCGHPIAIDESWERVVMPTRQEESENIDGVGITIGFCRQVKPCTGERCGKRYLFTRNHYPGGWGPVHQPRDASVIAAYRRRLREAKNSDWVWGWHKVHFGKIKVGVR